MITMGPLLMLNDPLLKQEASRLPDPHMREAFQNSKNRALVKSLLSDSLVPLLTGVQN